MTEQSSIPMAGVHPRRRSAARSPHPTPTSDSCDLRSEISSFTGRRKRTSMGHRRLSSLLSPPFLPCQPAGDCVAVGGQQSNIGMRFLLQKELRNSDVSSLGRIVLPKKEAEAYLPVLTAREGIILLMHDLDNSQLWEFRYRFWPNNKSRMYILENTGHFIKSHNLQLGDFIMLYKDDDKDRYMICGKKSECKEELPLAPLPMEDEIFDCIVADIVVGRARYSDLYLPLADGLTCSFPGEFTMSFADEMVGSTLTESILKLGSMDNLSLDEYSAQLSSQF